MPAKPTLSRALKRLGIASAVLLLSLYLLLPAGMGAFAALRPPKAGGAAPSGFEDVKLTAADGTELAGWYAPGRNGAALLLLHGSKGNRDAVRPYAQMLADNGFGVLAIDLRGCGLSGGQANAFGWQSSLDVGAAVDFLQNQPGVKAIGALGISLGGEVLLGAASEYPQIAAIISDGASHRCTADYIALPSNKNLYRSWTTRVLYATVALFTGSQPPLPITQSIKKAPGTALLLIAAGNSQKEIDYNTMYRDTAAGPVRLWVVPGVGHTGAFQANSAEYSEETIKFYQTALLEAKTMP